MMYAITNEWDSLASASSECLLVPDFLLMLVQDNKSAFPSPLAPSVAITPTGKISMDNDNVRTD